MTVYTNLDDALEVVAKASFYEDKAITPVADGWAVSDTTAHASDEWYWTYETGVKDRGSVSETSRLHESYESYDNAAHIRYNMSDSVELLEARTHTVEFAYAIVTDENSIGEDDGLAGWILVTNHYPL